MIIVTTIDGELLVYAQLGIPAAPHGQWSPKRTTKLADLIKSYVEAAELVDDAENIIERRPQIAKVPNSPPIVPNVSTRQPQGYPRR